VNRIKITGNWASRALSEDRRLSLSERWKNYGSHLVFKMVIFASDVFFYFSKVKQWMGMGKGMDDDIEEHMRKIAKDYGLEMQHGVFDG
jgi:aarF domain-containing kinase